MQLHAKKKDEKKKIQQKQKQQQQQKGCEPSYLCDAGAVL